MFHSEHFKFIMWKSFLITIILLHACVGNDVEDCPNIIKRSQWSSVESKFINYLILPIPYVIIHHTVTSECNTKSQCVSKAESIRSYHMDINGWADIGYSFLIGGDGNVYEGCGWNREGAHTYGYNKKSIGIAFIGNFQDKLASDKMMEAAHKLILCGKAQSIFREDVRVLGARQVGNTASPGFELYGQIQNWSEWVSRP